MIRKVINVLYPFGSLMPERSFNANGYRFGFNGKEKDDEIDNVTGSKLDFGARIYDSRLGRWLSIDPLAAKYPSLSAYVYTANNPILNREIDGRDFEVSIVHNEDGSGGTIIIKATIYTTESGMDRACNVENFMEAHSDKFNYVTSSGAEYNIQFQIDVQVAKEDVLTTDLAANDYSGNSFDVVSRANESEKFGSNTAGDTYNQKNSRVRESYEGTKYELIGDVHEFIHTLTSDRKEIAFHSPNNGDIFNASLSNAGYNIGTNVISNILSGFGIGEFKNKYPDQPIIIQSADNEINKPKDFESGYVEEIE